MAGPTDPAAEETLPQHNAAASFTSSAQNKMLPPAGSTDATALLPTPGPLVFAVNGKKVVLTPGTWEVSMSLNEYLRALMRGTVRLCCG